MRKLKLRIWKLLSLRTFRLIESSDKYKQKELKIERNFQMHNFFLIAFLKKVTISFFFLEAFYRF